MSRLSMHRLSVRVNAALGSCATRGGAVRAGDAERVRDAEREDAEMVRPPLILQGLTSNCRCKGSFRIGGCHFAPTRFQR